MKSKIAILLLVLCGSEYIIGQSQSNEMQPLNNIYTQHIGDSSDYPDSLDLSNDDPYKYWLTFSTGFIPQNYISSSYSYHFSWREYFIKAGIFGRISWSLSGLQCTSYDISLGKRNLTKWFMGSYYLGLAYTKGELRDNGNTNRFNTIGLQGNVQYVLRLADEIGIGVGGYANLNYFRSYLGAEINFTIGNGK